MLMKRIPSGIEIGRNQIQKVFLLMVGEGVVNKKENACLPKKVNPIRDSFPNDPGLLFPNKTTGK
jgi:hypothetical protein